MGKRKYDDLEFTVTFKDGQAQVAINDLKKGVKGVGDEIDKAKKKSKRLFSSWQKGIIVMNQAWELSRKLRYALQALSKPALEAGQFEQFRTTLLNLLGDVEEADKRFRALVRFAAVTPFNVPGVIEAGNRLESLGRFSMKTIRNLGDLAAASGKDVMQAVEAYTNLVTGRTGFAVKQFRALLISTNDWVRATGKQVLQSVSGVKASVQDMVSALPRIIASKNFSGLMEAQSQTLLGKISNLEDAFQQLQAAIGDLILPQAKQFITDLSDSFMELKDSIGFYYRRVKLLIPLAKTLGYAFIFWNARAVLLHKVLGTQLGLIQLLQKGYKALVARTVAASRATRVLSTSLIMGQGRLKRFGMAAKLSFNSFFKLKKGVALTGGAVTGFISVLFGAIYGLKLLRDALKITYKDKLDNARATVELTKKQVADIEATVENAKAKVKLLETFNRLKKVEQNAATHSKEYTSTLEALKWLYPELVDRNNNFNKFIDNSATLFEKAKEELRKYNKELQDFSYVLFANNLDVAKSEIGAVLEDMSAVVEDSKEWWAKFLQFPINTIFGDEINDIFNMYVGNIDDITQKLSKVWSKEEADKILNPLKDSLKFLRNYTKDGEEGVKVTNKQYVKLIKLLDLLEKKTLRNIELKKKGIFETETEKFRKAIKLDIKDKNIGDDKKKLLEYYKKLSDVVNTSGFAKIGGMLFDFRKYFNDPSKGKGGIEDRLRAGFSRVLDKEKNLILEAEKAKEKELSDIKKKNEKKRNALYTTWREKFERLKLTADKKSIDGYKKYYNDLLILAEKFNKALAKEIGSGEKSNKEIQLQKSISGEINNVLKNKVGVIRKQKEGELFTSAFKGEGLLKRLEIYKSYKEELKKIFPKKDDGSINFDVISTDILGVFNTINKNIDKTIAKIRQNKFNEILAKIFKVGSIKDFSFIKDLKATPEELRAYYESISNMNEDFLNQELALNEKNVRDRQERRKADAKSKIKFYTNLKSIQEAFIGLTTKGDVNETSKQKLIRESFHRWLLNNKIETDNSLTAEGEKQVTAEQRQWERKVEAASNALNRISSVLDKITNAKKDSIRKEVEDWKKGELEKISSEEKNLLQFARTEQQKNKLKEKFDKEREDLDKAAEKKRQEKAASLFAAQKAVSIAQATISTYTGAANALKDYPYPFSAIIAGLIIATGLADVAVISSQQPPSFDTGGFTGVGRKDEPAGVVHKGEYVVKASEVPKYISILELMNKGQFGDGGIVGKNTIINVPNDLSLYRFSQQSSSGNVEKKLDKLINIMSHYMQNPVPPNLYIDKNASKKITVLGLSTIKRSVG